MKILGLTFLFIYFRIYLDPMQPAPKLSPDHECLYKMGGFLNWMGPDMVQFMNLLVVLKGKPMTVGSPIVGKPQDTPSSHLQCQHVHLGHKPSTESAESHENPVGFRKKKPADKILYILFIYIYIYTLY